MSKPKILKSCDGKIAHKTKLSAKFFLNQLTTNKNANIYKCKHCKKWHIGNHYGEKKMIPKTQKSINTTKGVFKDYKIKVRKMKY